jgi:two-component system invasion response regulator UvrY
MIRVLLADDHTVVRRGLKQILAETEDIRTEGEVDSGADVLRAVRRKKYDIVLLDITLPDQNGLEVLGQLRAAHPNLPVLMLSVHPEEQYAVRALTGGAAGYLTKDSAPEEMVAAIRKVYRGGKYVSAALAERLAGLLGAQEGTPHESLSEREFQVMLLLANGKSVSEIADRLALSPKTVSTYRARLMEKLGVKSIAELVRYVMEQGLI